MCPPEEGAQPGQRGVWRRLRLAGLQLELARDDLTGIRTKEGGRERERERSGVWQAEVEPPQKTIFRES